MGLQLTTPISTLFSTEEIHIELSSKCTLKCPRCPRTELKPEQLNREISLNEFMSAFSPETLSSIGRVVFCGDVGDPIYAKDFLEIVKYIKDSSNTSISIVTNASYKDEDWWTRLGSLLDRHDRITFSVDGWDQKSNEKYRVNCDFESIVNGARAFRKASQCRMNWSAIYFSFNENDFYWIEELARDLGFDTFESVRSSKFDGRYLVNGIDLLKPKQEHFSNSTAYKKQKKYLTPAVVDITLRKTNAHPWAKCLRWSKELFISVDGLVFPCPWFNSGYQNNDFVQKYKDKLNIKTRPLTDILNDPLWDEFLTRIELMPLDVCRIKCKDCNE